ncbi:hypothetical protein AURDEDRAFT_185917 [Auricularia subglabra TFB-10046 SS5]|nr:hypothetical protein AURDEDRAFT_185917 [Auricularia subglabra TFB-10046 SS5]
MLTSLSGQLMSDELARCIGGDVRTMCELRHPNVQAFLGLCSDKTARETYAVFNHIKGVPVLPFLAQNAPSDRRKLVSELANGLDFLHERGLVHGSVCSDNIIVARDGRAVLLGMGCKSGGQLATLRDPDWMYVDDEWEDEPEPQISVTELQQADDPRYDYRADPGIRHVVADGVVDAALAAAARQSLHSDSTAGDVFAFGFAVVEIFTGIRSSSTPSALRLLRMVSKAAWPPHPGRIAELRGLDQALWGLCLRSWRLPGVQPIDMTLVAATMNERSDIVVCPVDWTLLELEAWTNAHVHTFTDVREFERVGPSRDIDENMVSIRIRVKHGGRKIQAKLISHGFLRRLRTKLKAAEQVAAGLTYMHTRSPAVVHGDVRAHNVVFTAEGIAQLANFDFGPQQDPVEGFDQSLSFTDAAVRNAAPDFINSRSAERTTWSDVYSFALFMYEMYSGHGPFHEVKNYQALLHIVRSGRLPDRPDHGELVDAIWALMNLFAGYSDIAARRDANLKLEHEL